MENGKYKCLLMIVDGMADLPGSNFVGRTPLESAFTPNMDRLASAGIYEQVEPWQWDNTPSSCSATAALMGLVPGDENRLKFGPLEAAGAGLALNDGDVALRVNFAAANPAFNSFMVNNRRAALKEEEIRLLAAELEQLDLGDGVHATFHSTGHYRGVVVLSGPDLDPSVSDSDPGEDELPAPVLSCRPLSPSARKTADKINELVKLAHSRLRIHPVNLARTGRAKLPANAIITRGAGSPITLGNVIRQKGLSAAVISGCNSVRGLGRIFDFTVISDPRFTATAKTNLAAKMQAALKALQDHDIVFVHIKAPDICARERQPGAKRDFIERLDAALAPIADRRLVTAITADRTTDSNTGSHTADPVPALIYSPAQGAGILGTNFGEEACRKGGMARHTAQAFLQRVLLEMGVG